MNHKILIVEDDRLNNLIYQYIFKKEPYAIDYALDGQQAIEKVENEDYSLVILDVNLPVIDGYGVAKYIRTLEKKEGKPRKPIIMVSASFDVQNKERLNAKKFDVDEFFPKPFNINVLKAVINGYISKFELEANIIQNTTITELVAKFG